MKKTVLITAILIFLLLFFACIYFMYPKDKDYVTFKSRTEEIKKSELNKKTTVYGWIQVQGTNIDYPVIEENELAYLSGINYIWRVNTYKEGENREVISGHNMLNVSSKPLIADPTHTRFEQLMSFVDYGFAKKNLYIQYTKDGRDELYKIYAIGFWNREDDEADSLTQEEIDDYVKKVRNNSIYDYDVQVNNRDTIISLITCTRYFGSSKKTNFKVDARKVRKNEKIQKYSVVTNENYDIINYDR